MVGTEEFYFMGSILLFVTILISIIFICLHEKAIEYTSKIFRIKLIDSGVGINLDTEYKHPLDS
jgi:hypothetical protein